MPISCIPDKLLTTLVGIPDAYSCNEFLGTTLTADRTDDSLPSAELLWAAVQAKDKELKKAHDRAQEAKARKLSL